MLNYSRIKHRAIIVTNRTGDVVIGSVAVGGGGTAHTPSGLMTLHYNVLLIAVSEVHVVHVCINSYDVRYPLKSISLPRQPLTK